MEQMSGANSAPWRRRLMAGVVVYGMTTFIVFLGSRLGSDARTIGHHPAITFHDGCSVYLNADGRHYLSIARNGYDYDSSRASLVAFFPMYPLASRSIAWGTGLRHELALLVAAHVFLVGAFIVFALYVRQPQGRDEGRVVGFTLLAFGLFPPSFFFGWHIQSPASYSLSCYRCWQ